MYIGVQTKLESLPMSVATHISQIYFFGIEAQRGGIKLIKDLVLLIYYEGQTFLDRRIVVSCGCLVPSLADQFHLRQPKGDNSKRIS